MTDEERAREIADTIIRDVAELPDRTSPDYDGDVMLVTADELRQIVMHPLAEALRSARLAERERCAKVAELPPIGGTILDYDTCEHIAAAIRETDSDAK